MQQQLIAQQNLQQQMIAAQMANKQAQINNILNNMGQGAGINNPVNSSNPINQSQQQSQPGITVYFRVSGMGKQDSEPIMIQCMPDEKVSEIIEKYRKKQRIKIIVINKPINETRDDMGFTVIGTADFLLRFIKWLWKNLHYACWTDV